MRLPGVRLLLIGLAAVVTVLAWPFSKVRRRARAAGLDVSPLARGAALGRNLCALLGAPPRLRIGGWSAIGDLDPGRGAVVLAAHLGPWEEGAAELARRGRRTAVIAAPWPRLPRTEARVAELRAASAVESIPRSRAGWRRATGHLRVGGTVVILVDSASPSRRGRRPVPFVDGAIGAPDAVLRWADRQGAAVVVAVGGPGSFDLTRLGDGPAEVRADHAVAQLGAAARARPSQWAWVRALAGLVLAVGIPAAVSGCESDRLPPLPKHAEHWVADAEQATWTGELPGGATGRFEVDRATLRWIDEGPRGTFEGIVLTVDAGGPQQPLGVVWAERGEGAWPEGPLYLHGVTWDLEVPTGAEGLCCGSLDTVRWVPEGGFACGGCALEFLFR